jgi:nitrogen fixation-related uncharacterized protein
MTDFDSTLLTLWIVFGLCGFAGMAAGLLWAVRRGQFSNQDRARYLALESRIVEEQEEVRRPTGP